jgi:hypothetical protein
VKIEQAECSEMSAYKIQMLGNYPEENVQQVLSYRDFNKGQIQFVDKLKMLFCLETLHLGWKNRWVITENRGILQLYGFLICPSSCMSQTTRHFRT